MKKVLLILFFAMLTAAAVAGNEERMVSICLLEVRDAPFGMRCVGVCSIMGDCPAVPYLDSTTWAPTNLYYCNCDDAEIWCSGGIPSVVPCQTFVVDYGNGILIAACMDCGCGVAVPEPPGSGDCARRTERSEEWHTMCDCKQ
jgi:hypothetical protein